MKLLESNSLLGQESYLEFKERSHIFTHLRRGQSFLGQRH